MCGDHDIELARQRREKRGHVPLRPARLRERDQQQNARACHRGGGIYWSAIYRNFDKALDCAPTRQLPSCRCRSRKELERPYAHEALGNRCATPDHRGPALPRSHCRCAGHRSVSGSGAAAERRPAARPAAGKRISTGDPAPATGDPAPAIGPRPSGAGPACTRRACTRPGRRGASGNTVADRAEPRAERGHPRPEARTSTRRGQTPRGGRATRPRSAQSRGRGAVLPERRREPVQWPTAAGTSVARDRRTGHAGRSRRASDRRRARAARGRRIQHPAARPGCAPAA